MIRFTLNHSHSPSAAAQQLIEYVARKGGTRPLYLWVREVAERDENGFAGTYEHFHLALLFDRAVVGPRTVKAGLVRLERRGWLVEGSHISRFEGDTRYMVHDLRDPKMAENYRHHMAYLAKCGTKPAQRGRRLFGSSSGFKSVNNVHDADCGLRGTIPIPKGKNATASVEVALLPCLGVLISASASEQGSIILKKRPIDLNMGKKAI
ncbi:hypothetical protein R0381_002595 [Jeongeupia wiesaeckerbachi]